MSSSDIENEYYEIIENMLKDTTANQYIEHTKRVVRYAKTIGSKMNADMSILVPAAILHDIGRCKDNTFVGHVEKGLPIARSILIRTQFDRSKIDSVLAVIAEHHYDLPKQVPDTIEARILLDADRLEIVGKYGLARWFLHFGATNSVEDACLNWLNLSNRRINGKRTFFCTEVGELMGIDGFKFCEDYCKSILDETMIR